MFISLGFYYTVSLINWLMPYIILFNIRVCHNSIFSWVLIGFELSSLNFSISDLAKFFSCIICLAGLNCNLALVLQIYMSLIYLYCLFYPFQLLFFYKLKFHFFIIQLYWVISPQLLIVSINWKQAVMLSTMMFRSSA